MITFGQLSTFKTFEIIANIYTLQIYIIVNVPDLTNLLLLVFFFLIFLAANLFRTPFEYKLIFFHVQINIQDTGPISFSLSLGI